MPHPVKISTDAIATKLDQVGASFVAEVYDGRTRYIDFLCACGTLVHRRAFKFLGDTLLQCRRCNPNKSKPPVSQGRIWQRLAEFGSEYVSHQCTSNGVLTSVTQVTFKCGGYKDHPCGTEVTRFWNDISRKGRKPLCQKCAQPRLRGKEHHLYNPDLTDRQREDSRWRAADREWAQQILARDQHTCQISGQVGGRLSAHHLNSRTKYPHLKLDLANGLTLSEDLHAEFHRRQGCKRNPTARAFLKFYIEKTGMILDLPQHILHPTTPSKEAA